MSVGIQVWSQTASSNSTIDTNINWAEGMAPSQVNDSARAMMASAAKWRDDNGGGLVTGGSTTAFTVTSNQVSTGNTNGYTISVRFHAPCGNAATLNVDGNGAASILYRSGGATVTDSQILSGETYRLTYSSTEPGWLITSKLLNTAANYSNNSVGYAAIQQVSGSRLLGNATGSTANVEEISLGTNLSFSGTTLNAGNNTPVISVFTSTTAATWQSTTQNGNFPLYLKVRMVGGGGGGGAETTNAGNAGTDTSFGTWTAIHGSGGQAGNGGGAGGAGGTGGTNGTGTVITRVDGSNGGALGNPTAGAFPGGNGASSIFGGGAAQVAGTGGNAKSNTGSGGGGGNGTGGLSGGAGGGAGEFVEFIITSPSTSYSYQVGGGGTGGSAGNVAGGNGAAGRIEVIAYWQ